MLKMEEMTVRRFLAWKFKYFSVVGEMRPFKQFSTIVNKLPWGGVMLQGKWAVPDTTE